MSDAGFFTSAEMRRVRAPLPTRARCDRCKLKFNCHSPQMPPSGRGDRGILIVGEYPGFEEDGEGIQFCGRSGSYLEGVLRSFGVDMRRDCWLTNAAICYGAHNHKTAVSDCRPNLMKTVKELDPRVILLLGGAAVDSLIGQLWKDDVGGVGRWVGWRIPHHKPNCWICPAHNPAFVQRCQGDKVLEDEFKSHTRAAVELSGRPWEKGPPNYENAVDVILSPDDAVSRLRRITSGVVAFDYETTCAKPDAATSEIVCASVCWNGTDTFAFPWHGESRTAMKELLTNYDVGKVAHNAKFEDRWTRAKLGVPVRGWVHDTMLTAHTLDPRKGVTGLKFQSYVRLGAPDYNYHLAQFLEPEVKGGYEANRVREIGTSLLCKYCGVDSLLTYKLALLQCDDLGVSFQ